ncbi:MAG: hypothetical protein E7315_04110 [Clostridiales bacterium]|nr:hypothetical protein [Clostridiales bacterium]
MVWSLKNNLRNHFINNRIYYIFISFFFIAGISCGFGSHQSSAKLYAFFTSKLFISESFFSNFGKNLLFSFTYCFSGLTVLCHLVVYFLVFITGCILGAAFTDITQIEYIKLIPFIFLSFVRFIFELYFMFFQATVPLRCSQKIISRRIKGIKKPLYFTEKREYVVQSIYIIISIIPLSLLEVIMYKLLSFLV